MNRMHEYINGSTLETWKTEFGPLLAPPILRPCQLRPWLDYGASNAGLPPVLWRVKGTPRLRFTREVNRQPKLKVKATSPNPWVCACFMTILSPIGGGFLSKPSTGDTSHSGDQRGRRYFPAAGVSHPHIVAQVTGNRSSQISGIR